jgi:hypothetical protein
MVWELEGPIPTLKMSNTLSVMNLKPRAGEALRIAGP